MNSLLTKMFALTCKKPTVEKLKLIVLELKDICFDLNMFVVPLALENKKTNKSSG